MNSAEKNTLEAGTENTAILCSEEECCMAAPDLENPGKLSYSCSKVTAIGKEAENKFLMLRKRR